MSRNMCKIDRVLRFVVGILLIYIGFVNTDMLGANHQVLNILLGIIGLMNIGSAFMGVCPIYKMANISSNKIHNKT